MDHYIEVEGVAVTEEEVVEHRAVLDLSVRAADLEGVVQEAEKLHAKCVLALLEAGIEREELTDGGVSVGPAWWRPKNPGQQSQRRILLACPDSSRLHRALGSLEPLFSSKRYTLHVDMQAPRFDCPTAQRDAALREAIEDARAKAQALAAASGVKLGRVQRVEEVEGRTGRSGAYGDRDAWDEVLVASAEPEEPTEIDAARRDRTFRLRVRFAIDG
ncbi:MAG: SIMPL domain-containing protein [Planctomycetota bacterium]